ncbi:MAG: Ada metal-binding domain-containing protein [Patescibacteria group bacterium]
MTIAERLRGYKAGGKGGGVPEDEADAYISIKDLGQPATALGAIRRVLGDWILVAIILLTASLAFGLGLLAGKDNVAHGSGDHLWIEQLPSAEHPSAPGAAATSTVQSAIPASKVVASQPAAAAAATTVMDGAYVASKTGTKYYPRACGTVKRIKNENRVWFATREEAEAAGYQPAANCKNL